jgi:hypothetical protein
MSELRGLTHQCGTARTQNAPVVAAWPASQKANLEVGLGRGGVAVAYSGCEMTVLPECVVKGAYRWARTSHSVDSIELNDEKDLYAKLPLSAISLTGEIKRTGKLSVVTEVVGQYRFEGSNANAMELEGDCSRATHVIRALSVGASKISRGGTSKVEAGFSTSVVGAGGSTSSGADLLQASGDTQSCSSTTDDSPHVSCRAPVQAFLWPLRGPIEEAPPGTVKVDVVSANAASRWDVYVEDNVVCTTPCTKWLDPRRPIFLRTRDDGMFFTSPDKIQLSFLDLSPDPGAVQVEAHPTSWGRLATGIVFTSLGGSALLSGISLTAVGCGGDKTMCEGGLITMAAGTAVTAGAIWLITSALPHAELWHDRQGAEMVAFGPSGFAGRF